MANRFGSALGHHARPAGEEIAKSYSYGKMKVMLLVS